MYSGDKLNQTPNDISIVYCVMKSVTTHNFLFYKYFQSMYIGNIGAYKPIQLGFM